MNFTASEQLSIFGRLLKGSETAVELARIARLHYLKFKLRRILEPDLGDFHDICSDLNKSLLLGLGIVSGQISKPDLITRYRAYIVAQIQLYGGPDAIMDKLEANAGYLSGLLQNYNLSKTDLAACTTEDEVTLLDLD